MILNLLNLTETTAKHCHTGKIMALDMGDDETAHRDVFLKEIAQKMEKSDCG